MLELVCVCTHIVLLTLHEIDVGRMEKLVMLSVESHLHVSSTMRMGLVNGNRLKDVKQSVYRKQVMLQLSCASFSTSRLTGQMGEKGRANDDITRPEQ